MDIEEVKAARVKLAANISEMVNSFQRQTGVAVKDIELTHLVSVASGTPVKTQVHVRLELF